MLSQGDSRSAAGWLAKLTFDDDCPMHLALARQFADFCITNDIVQYTQWFPGKKNNVADVLSRDFALNDEEVTKHIHENCSPFAPQYFRIIPCSQRSFLKLETCCVGCPKLSSCRLNPCQAQ
jgi:hypothetical protein